MGRIERHFWRDYPETLKHFSFLFAISWRRDGKGNKAIGEKLMLKGKKGKKKMMKNNERVEKVVQRI